MRPLQAGEVLLGTIGVAALLATMAVVASGDLTEEVKEEVTEEAMQGVAVSLEASKAAEALEVPEEEVMEGVTGKLKE